jgi:hypothetical protein
MTRGQKPHWLNGLPPTDLQALPCNIPRCPVSAFTLSVTEPIPHRPIAWHACEAGDITDPLKRDMLKTAQEAALIHGPAAVRAVAAQRTASKATLDNKV